MVNITPLVKQGAQIIQSYSDHSFRVSGRLFQGAVFVLPEESFAWAYTSAFEDLTAEDFDILAARAEGLDVVLLGCGGQGKFLGSALKTALKAKGLNVEVMDSGAASRTYNVLMAEGRRVAAALLPF